MRVHSALALVMVWAACGRSALEAFAPGDAHWDSTPVSDSKTDAKFHAASDGACAWGFAPPVKYTVTAYTNYVAAGDFNGDGYPDLVFSTMEGNTIGVLLNAGDGTFLPQVTYTVGQTAVYAPGGDFIAVGDFNGDGALDIAVVNCNSSSSVSVLLNAGDGTFLPQATYTVGSHSQAIAVGDFNRDGFPDIVVANFDGYGSVSVLLNTGDGAFRPRKCSTRRPAVPPHSPWRTSMAMALST